MKKHRLFCCTLLFALILPWVGARGWADSTTPSFKITAAAVSLTGRGQGTSQYTITSVNGFSGKVAVVCNGPDPNLYPYLVMPSCAEPTQNLQVPANGSASGGMIFHPPWVDLTTESSRARLGGAAPLWAGLFVGLGLLGLRKKLGTRLFMGLGVVCLTLLSAAVGCGGSSGLQMTPGTYIFTLTGTGDGVTATGKVTVTVHCDTCP